MASCPRCGAENQPGRASCWNCWETLPSTPDEEAPAESPISPDAVQVPLPTPSPATGEDARIDPPIAPAAASSRGGATVWVGGPAKEDTVHDVPESHGGGWARIIIVALSVILLALVLLWHYTFRPEPPSTAVADVAQDYVAALAVHDTQTQQQLATEDSKGLLLPGWLTVASGVVQQPASDQGEAASVEVDFTLSPAAVRVPLPHNVVGALSRRYSIPLELQLEADGWRVDQQAFLTALKKTLTAKNPGVKFPKWE
ncbi:MAG: cysteine-rich CWC family protein [Armatimonadota bacterium]